MINSKDISYRYPGTKPFKQEEFNLFRGRDEDIQNLYELISIQNLIVLYGRSGLGKSSLLNAGLTRRLKDAYNTSSVFIRFGAYFIENQEPPLEKLNKIIEEEYQPDTKNFLFNKLMPAKETAAVKLWYTFKSLQIKNKTTNTFILIFDQFEELFSYHENEISKFKKELSELLFVKVPQQLRNLLKDKLLNDKNYLSKEEAALLFTPLNIKIIFSIRSDKLSLLNNLSDVFPGILKSYYELKSLNRPQAKQAIEIPAQLNDKSYASSPFLIDEDALNFILDSLTGSKKQENIYSEEKQGIETFQLQIVCKYIENLVIKKSLKTIAKSDLRNIKEIFEDHYVNIIKELPPKYQPPARKLIEEKLIIDGSRVCMPVPFLINNMKEDGVTKELIDDLINTHILRPEHNNSVEISHDTLIEPILRSRERRINIHKKEQQVLYRILGVCILGILLLLAALQLFKNTRPQTQNNVDIRRINDSVTAVIDSVKQKATNNVVDSIRMAMLSKIQIQYRCFYEKDMDDSLLNLLNEKGYTKISWIRANRYNAYKPNALFYGTEIPVEYVKEIALIMLKKDYKLQRIADIRLPYTIQIWISPENLKQPALTENEIKNADSKEALNRGTKIPQAQ